MLQHFGCGRWLGILTSSLRKGRMKSFETNLLARSIADSYTQIQHNLLCARRGTQPHTHKYILYDITTYSRTLGHFTKQNTKAHSKLESLTVDTNQRGPTVSQLVLIRYISFYLGLLHQDRDDNISDLGIPK